jgi:hypothetical protein
MIRYLSFSRTVCSQDVKASVLSLRKSPRSSSICSCTEIGAGALALPFKMFSFPQGRGPETGLKTLDEIIFLYFRNWPTLFFHIFSSFFHFFL